MTDEYQARAANKTNKIGGKRKGLLFSDRPPPKWAVWCRLPRERPHSFNRSPRASPRLGYGGKFAGPPSAAAEIHEDPVRAVDGQAEVRQALLLQPDGDVRGVQGRGCGGALWEVEPEFLHRDRRGRLLRCHQRLRRSVRVGEGLALGLPTEHHRVAGTSWVRKAHLAPEVGEHDAQRQSVSVFFVLF
jgi:hypothetical protein